MKQVQYIDLEQAREVLAEMGISLSPRQMKRAADMDATGKRKLPFFIDPIDGRLRIEKSTLTSLYMKKQVDAENACSSLRMTYSRAVRTPAKTLAPD